MNVNRHLVYECKLNTMSKVKQATCRRLAAYVACAEISHCVLKTLTANWACIAQHDSQCCLDHNVALRNERKSPVILTCSFKSQLVLLYTLYALPGRVKSLAV